MKAWVKRCGKTNNGVFASSVECEKCWEWACRWASSFMHQGSKEACIPSDVPKGHLVVYVGENQRASHDPKGSKNHVVFLKAWIMCY
ncbi:hypothetical protein L1987_12257 [Smallanthus sonchifolius]|uniref:Uncharacterized protein n=1 Tax=Smallanthus sonchifolius TaxID=185202 RepID=A0ACB9JFW3_9ASTR|nr:hypothetical protein L1987_12257 [Smallanthus sonchifolius]